MNRPKDWNRLPWPLVDWLLEHDSNEYDYEPYESSRDEAINELKYNPDVYNRNYKMIQRLYESYTDEQLIDITKELIVKFNSTIDYLNDFINEEKEENIG